MASISESDIARITAGIEKAKAKAACAVWRPEENKAKTRELYAKADRLYVKACNFYIKANTAYSLALESEIVEKGP